MKTATGFDHDTATGFDDGFDENAALLKSAYVVTWHAVHVTFFELDSASFIARTVLHSFRRKPREDWLQRYSRAPTPSRHPHQPSGDNTRY